MIAYLLLEALFFVFTQVLPIFTYIVFLPVAFSVSEDNGLDTLAIWVVYHMLLSFAKPVTPRLVTHLLSFATAIVAIGPFGYTALNLIAPIETHPLVDFAFLTARHLVRFVILYTPPILALVEGFVSLVLIKIICRWLQAEIHEDDRPKIIVPILIGTLGAVYQLYSLYSLTLADHQNAQYVIVGVSTLCILVFLSMITFLQPGDNDAPGIEILLLTMYVAFSISATFSPSISICRLLEQFPFKIDLSVFDTAAGYLQSWMINGPSKPNRTWMDFAASAIIGVLDHMPWWTAALLLYRSVIFSILSSFFLTEWSSEYDSLSPISIAVGVVDVFGAPFMLLYYGRIIMEAFRLIHSAAPPYVVASLSTGTALVLQLCSIIVLVMRDM